MQNLSSHSCVRRGDRQKSQSLYLFPHAFPDCQHRKLGAVKRDLQLQEADHLGAGWSGWSGTANSNADSWEHSNKVFLLSWAAHPLEHRVQSWLEFCWKTAWAFTLLAIGATTMADCLQEQVAIDAGGQENVHQLFLSFVAPMAR